MSKRILDFCIISGETVKKYDGVKKYIATGDIIDNKISSYTEVEFSNKPSRANQIANVGDVIFAKMKDTQKVISIDEENSKYIYSTGFYIIKPKENVLTDYLYWLFNSAKFNREKDRNCKGATQKALNNKGLNKIEINELPNIDGQKDIVCKLNKIKEIITKKKEQIVMLDDIVKSQFVEMFGIPFLNNKKWKNGTIRDLVREVKYGTSKPANGGKYKYLRMNNITYDGKLDVNELKYINIAENEIEKYTTQKGDILFNRTNSRDLVGKTCVFNLDEKMVIAGFIIRVRVNDLANPYFISTYLNTIYLKNKLYNMCKNASGQSNINAQELQNIEIYIPPIELQNQFADFVKQIDKQKFEIEKSLEEMQELYESLMEKYFG